MSDFHLFSPKTEFAFNSISRGIQKTGKNGRRKGSGKNKISSFIVRENGKWLQQRQTKQERRIAEEE
jgi:hypothetical protein